MQNKIKQRFLIVILILSSLFPLPCYCQSDAKMDSLATSLEPLAKNSPKEQIYLQTSKGIYESGEDLWFKAYILNSQSFIPSTLSKTLYVRLIDENAKKFLWQEKYEIKNGFADGQVYLPDTLSEGNYILQAFTSNSFYADSGQFVALRKIQVVKSYKSIVGTSKGETTQPKEFKKTDIQFHVFPEGGKLIHEIPSRLAFKAVDAKGEPLRVSGTLFQDGQALQTFKSEHAGMGSIGFTPITGKKYDIRLSEPKTDNPFLLPKVYPDGISLRLASRDSNYLEFVISKSPGLKNQTVYLRGQLRGITCCMASGRLENQLKIRMPLKEFTLQGIAEFTLFNEAQQPMAERLVYVHPQKKLYITARLSREQFKLREKASLKIQVSNEKGQPVAASLGISVFDKLYQNPKDPKNILTHYYLSGQLKGRIYDPAYYFDEKNKDREQALDLLLLTQGWRNYVWSEENLTKYKAPGKPIISDGIAGEVHFTKKLKQAPNGAQFVMSFSPDEKGNTKNTGLIPADSDGRFIIGPQEPNSGHGNYVYLKPMGTADFEPRISINDPFEVINRAMQMKQVSYPLSVSYKKKAEALKSYEIRPMTVKLDEVVVKARGTQVFRDKYLGRLDSLAKADLNTDFVGIPCNTLNCPFHNRDRSKKPVEGKSYKVLLGKNGEILGSDYSQKSYFGERNIIYHNSNLHFTEEELLKRNNLTRIKGYYAQREFYQPNYDKEPAGDGLPDARNTLLWAPNVITDEKGEATVSFFCSDINTGFLGKIEGVNGEGLLGMHGFEFVVRKTESLKRE